MAIEPDQVNPKEAMEALPVPMPGQEGVAAEPLIAPVGGPRRFVILRTLFASPRSRRLGITLLVVIAVALIAPHFMSYGTNEQDLFHRLLSPTADHWLGSDSLGRDIFTLLLTGLRLSLYAGAIAVGVAVVLGVPAGAIAGFAGGFVHGFFNTISDVLLCIPPLIFALAIIGIVGPSTTNAMIAIGIVSAPRFFRVTRATTQSIREKTFIEASRAVGCSTPRLLFRHVLTNSFAPLVVTATFAFAVAIVAEASLSFLGLGTQPPASSLGTMVADAFKNIGTASWPIWPPAIVIAGLVYLISQLGDSMQDSLKTGGAD